MSTDNSEPKLERFLICGLGSLGQHCAIALREFGVATTAIELTVPPAWEFPDLPTLVDEIVVGDCCQDSVLKRAKIRHCRAALIVTSNERVNIETALAIRHLNPQTRLVIRSTQENLDRLLQQQVGNSIAFDPIGLPASAFAFAALGSETLGFFKLDGQWLQVFQRRIESSDRWCNARMLWELNSRKRRLIHHFSLQKPNLASFHHWEPETRLQANDTLVYVEMAEALTFNPLETTASRQQKTLRQSAFLDLVNPLKERLGEFWALSFQQQGRRVASICGLTVLGLLVLGAFLFHEYDPTISLGQAFYISFILLLGGYADLFGEFPPIQVIPDWLQLFALTLTVAGTAFVGVLYALLTETLLSSKFQFAKRRPPIPQQNHIAIVGLGRIGQRVAALLGEFKQTIVGISIENSLERPDLPNIALVSGTIKDSFANARLDTAKSVVAVTGDEILNLEIALMVQSVNPECHLAIRTSGRRLSDRMSQLFPKAHVLGTYAITAEVFAAAAFGENVIDLFRLNGRTILVTEYFIEEGDSLNGLLLSEVNYGYGVISLLHQKTRLSSNLMPSDDIRLIPGDRLIVLATIEGLQGIEKGNLDLKAKCWQVSIEAALSPDSVFEGANAIARISGCALGQARDLMHNLPTTLPFRLYQHQAQRLVRELHKVLVKANYSTG